MTNREREFASLGVDYAEGIESCEVIVLTTGREVRRCQDGGWEVQPRNDNYWLKFKDALEAVRCGLGVPNSKI